MSNCSEIESCFACESCLNDYLRAGLTTRSNFVATLPTGERVELPAGTVLREGTLPPEPEDDRPTLGEQILADLTERAGLPRDPPRCTGKRPANAGTTGIECDDYACDVHGRGSIRRLREMAPSEWPTPRAMAEIACRKRTLGQGFQSGFEEGVTAERARFEAAPLVSLADHAKQRT